MKTRRGKRGVLTFKNLARVIPMIGWLKRWLSRQSRIIEVNSVPDELDQPQQAPEPHEEQVAQPPQDLSPLMQRVKEARDANDVDALRRFRWCFHEAAHAIVGHYYDATVRRILVDVGVGNRPRAIIDNKTLKPLAAAVTNYGAGTPQVREAALPFFAQYAAGELLDNEVQPHFPLLSTKLTNQAWDKNIPGDPETDLDIIVKMARGAGLRYRSDLVQAGEVRAMEIITERRDAFESLVTHLHDIGNIEGQTLQNILNM